MPLQSSVALSNTSSPPKSDGKLLIAVKMKYKILVVDDDKELVKMLCSYFNMRQYETITATDGMEALNKRKMKPDIILLDINMPVSYTHLLTGMQ